MDDERRALIGLIEKAFSGVALGEGVGLRQAIAIDDNASPEEERRARLRDETEDWSAIPAERLRACSSALSFFDPAGMRFHLPRYMIALLRREYARDEYWPESFAFTLTTGLFEDHRGEEPRAVWRLDESAWSRARFGALDEAQRGVVRAFLLYGLRFYAPGFGEDLDPREVSILIHLGHQYLFDWEETKQALALFWSLPAGLSGGL